ncbi:MAG: stage II sporulation protein R [Sedimentibacter sp.]
MHYYKKILISLVVVILTIATSYSIEAYSGMTKINDKVIRFHVIANSNTLEDQQLKYSVRDKVISTFTKKFENISTKEESEIIVLQNINEIRTEAESVVESNGFNYEVNVYYGNYKFPRKLYNDIVLPEGYYDAVRIEIGKAEGNNWWCVMFPPLCFVNLGKDQEKTVFDIDTEKRLQEVLTQKEIEAIKTKRGLEDITLKSKLFEFIEKGRVENTGIYSNDRSNTYAVSLSK